MKLETPILFIVFNRPETTRKVFKRIRQQKPKKLYVAADGPRDIKPGEKIKCRDTRGIFENIDWDCELKTLFRDKNLGCKRAVSGAIDWFFQNEEQGIILEDDCLPNQSFFRFCEVLLKKYQEHEKIMSIAGSTMQPVERSENSYYFSKYMHCWGWATWRRAWNHYDVDISSWPVAKKDNFLHTFLNSDKAAKYWNDKLDSVYNKNVDTWDYQWVYSIWRNDGLNITPNKNLIKNIGFGHNATHTKNKYSNLSERETDELAFPLSHPKSICPLKKADQYTQELYQTPFYKKIFPSLVNYIKDKNRKFWKN